jgi:hypothetical protein
MLAHLVYPQSMEGYLTLKQAAEQYGYADGGRALRAALKRGTLKGQQVGVTWLVAEADAAAYHARTGGQPGYPRGWPRSKTGPPKEAAP